MKLLLFFISTICSVTALTQEQNQLRVLQNNNGGMYLSRNDSAIIIMKKYLEYTNQSSGIINLSQDNMPCVIPNTKLANGMPNLWKGSSPYRKKKGALPNPALPENKGLVPMW